VTHTSSYPVGTIGVRRPGREADQSPPSSTDVNMGQLYVHIHVRVYSAMLDYIIEHRSSFVCTLETIDVPHTLLKTS
jgi:hypothetical protein